MKELLTPGGEHNGIGDGEGLVMTKIEDPPLRSPKRTPDLASDEEQEVTRLRLVEHDNSVFLIFFLEICDFIASVSGSSGPPGGDTPPGCA